MSRYLSSPDYRHDAAERIGVLLVNSGTPDSLSLLDVRRFLGRLLSDPRVIEFPRALWLPLLHGVILTVRPWRSRRKYLRIWTERGSPLLAHSAELRQALAREVGERVLAPLSVEIAMLYAKPTVRDALRRLREIGAQRILVLPLFPQYCGATTGAVYDQVTRELGRWRWLPELRFVAEYNDHPGYIEALRASIEEHWAANGRTQHLLLSFHSIPDRYFRQGDPYYCKCQKSARLLADELNLRDGEWSLSFQSRVGPTRWIGPYTDEVLAAMPGRGIESVTVACPGFAVDCLESLEEIGIENRDRFLRAGGKRFQYVPALNARHDHVVAVADLIAQHCQGWTPINVEWLAAARNLRSDESSSR